MVKAQPLDQLNAELGAMIDSGALPGVAVRIERGGETLADVRLGYRDVASKTPLGADAIYRLYSMSKPITSVAIMMLAEQGRLDLHAPVSRFLPELADARVYAAGEGGDIRTVPLRRPITAADLLSHASGVTYHFTGDTPVHRYYRAHGVMRDTPVGRMPGDGAPARTLDELVARIGQAPLLRQPGERFDYSYSTTLLGAVVERATGQRLDQALRTMLFAPLEMADTGFFIEDVDVPRLVTNYAATAKGLIPIETAERSEYRDRSRLLDGGGALAGTLGDYLNFCRMLGNGGVFRGRRLLSEASLAEMMIPRVKTDMPPVSLPFGYGFAIGDAATDAAGLLPQGAASWAGSAGTFFHVDPRSKLSVVVMTHVLVAPPLETTTILRGHVNAAARALVG